MYYMKDYASTSETGSPFANALLSLATVNGNENGASKRPRAIPIRATAIPKIKPMIQKSIFIPISQMKPSRSNVKMRPGALKDFVVHVTTMSDTTVS